MDGTEAMEYIKIITLVLSALGLLVGLFNTYNTRIKDSKDARKHMLEKFTATGWHNEGDIFNNPKAHYTLKIFKSNGLSSVRGSLYINIDEQSYDFHGAISNKGILKTTLKMPIGKCGSNIAKVRFVYSEENDVINYVFEGYIDNKEMVPEHLAIDTQQELWRSGD